MIKRFGLFIVINFLIMSTVFLILNIFNVQPYLTPYGLDYKALAIFSLIYGMVGSFISLMMSKTIAKWMMKVQIINNTSHPLVRKVYAISERAGLKKMPEVGIYQSNVVNAFATGPSKSNSLVAVSSALLDRMSDDEVEGVLAHEVSHIANGDMVTMTLLQGIVNAFVIFLSTVIAHIVTSAMSKGDRGRRGSNYFMFSIVRFLFQIVFMILGSIVVSFFSRIREYRADSGSAMLVGRDKMIAALQALKTINNPENMIREESGNAAAFNALKISSGKGMMNLFSTHPALDDRINRLRNN
ncbi:MAG: protease HtpX [Candidatus Muiribacteriota bacterium]